MLAHSFGCNGRNFFKAKWDFLMGGNVFLPHSLHFNKKGALEPSSFALK